MGKRSNTDGCTIAHSSSYFIENLGILGSHEIHLASNKLFFGLQTYYPIANFVAVSSKNGTDFFQKTKSGLSRKTKSFSPLCTARKLSFSLPVVFSKS